MGEKIVAVQGRRVATSSRQKKTGVAINGHSRFSVKEARYSILRSPVILVAELTGGAI
jgi:hypothetical protein